jgi:hypothetical protein
MTTQVIATPGTAGRFWGDGRTIAALNSDAKITTEWDLIVSLAKKEGYDAWVKGSVLYFQPPLPANSTPHTWLHKIDAQGRQRGNVRELDMDRTLTISKGVNVKVNSWNSKQSRQFTKTSSTPATIDTSGRNRAQTHIHQHPNLTEDEAQQKADTIKALIAMHELNISATLPGDLLLTPRTIVNLTGTGTAFDQLYYCMSVTREISNSAGFVMHSTCKSKAAEDEATTLAAEQANKSGGDTDPVTDAG